MVNKEIILITGNTSWWKEKKFRLESAQVLNEYRKKGWRLRKKVILDKNSKIRYKHVGPIMQRDLEEIKNIIRVLENED